MESTEDSLKPSDPLDPPAFTELASPLMAIRELLAKLKSTLAESRSPEVPGLPPVAAQVLSEHRRRAQAHAEKVTYVVEGYAVALRRARLISQEQYAGIEEEVMAALGSAKEDLHHVEGTSPPAEMVRD
jgi:hypothetical protein